MASVPWTEWSFALLCLEEGGNGAGNTLVMVGTGE